MRIFPAPIADPLLDYLEEQIKWVRDIQKRQDKECNKDRCVGMLVMLYRIKIYLVEGKQNGTI